MNICLSMLKIVPAILQHNASRLAFLRPIDHSLIGEAVSVRTAMLIYETEVLSIDQLL